MTRTLIARAALLALLACAPTGRADDVPALTPELLAGSYGPAGYVASLDLDAEGGYECMVVTGMTPDGCITFEGAGMSSGRWTLDDETITFTPTTDESHLAFKLAGASAVVSGLGLKLRAEGKDYELARKHGPPATDG